MMSRLYICLLFFGLTSRCFSRDDVFFKKYVSLICNLHKFHGTSSVFFLFSHSERHFEDYTLAHFLSRDFSQRRIFNSIINIDELDFRTKFYRKRIVRPLIVVLMKTMSDVAEFYKHTQEMILYPVWLMIFIGESGKTLCDYCAHPTGNSLNLRFNTEMLVVCCDDPMMKEWWSVHENRTEVGNFATWAQDEELIYFVPNEVYCRRRDVEGAGLRMVFVTNKGVNGLISRSLFGDIVLELKRSMNFTITVALPVETTGSFDIINNSWSGAVGQLARRQADVGIGEFSMTSARLRVIDFTLPLLLTRTRLYIKQPDSSGVQWSAYFKAFTFKIWMTIIFIITTSSIILTIIKIKENNYPSASLVVENYLSVWGLFCQQGLFKFPAETPLRIACFSILVLALIIFTAYSASLTSYLAVYSSSMPFESLSGFINEGSYKLVVIQGSSSYDFFANSNDRKIRQMMKMMKPLDELPKTYRDGFQQVCKERVAFYTNEAVKQIMNNEIKCKIVSIETERTDSLALVISKDNQYSGIMNYHIQRLKDSGMIDRLKRNYVVEENEAQTIYDVVSLWGVAPILSVLGGGIIISVVIMIFERIYFSLKRTLRTLEHTMDSQDCEMDTRPYIRHNNTPITLESTQSI